MRVLIDGMGAVDLPRGAFIGQGAQGTVFGLPDGAVKVWSDPAAGVPAAKLVRLAGIRAPGLVTPRSLVRDGDGAVIGFTMPRVPSPRPAAALIPRIAREQLGLDAAAMRHLVGALRDAVRRLHDEGGLVVDLSENNLLVDRSLSEIHIIDADSWQIDQWPARALTESVRDRRAKPGVFDAGTDWFSFAVVSFALQVGVHPFRGVHPVVKGLDARMDAGISVFAPDVKLPAACEGLEVLAPRWRDWYEAVLEKGHRGPPPGGSDRGYQSPSRPAPEAQAVTTQALFRLDEPILALAERGGTITSLTASGIYVGTRRIGPRPEGRRPVFVYVPGDVIPAVVLERGHQLVIVDCATGDEQVLEAHLDDWSVCGERVVARMGDLLSELRFVRLGEQLVATWAPLGQVLGSATRLFRGVAIQSLFGACWVTPLTGKGAPQLRVRALDGVSWVTAAADGPVLAGVVASPDGGLERVLLRWSPDGRVEVDRRSDVSEHQPQVVALGDVVVVTEPGDRLTLLAARAGDPMRREVRDPFVGAVQLMAYRTGLAALADGVLLRLSLKST